MDTHLEKFQVFIKLYSSQNDAELHHETFNTLRQKQKAHISNSEFHWWISYLYIKNLFDHFGFPENCSFPFLEPK